MFDLLTIFNMSLQILADMFSFDIRQFLDEEEEETTSKVLDSIPDDLKVRLADISDWLGASLDILVIDCGPIRARF